MYPGHHPASVRSATLGRPPGTGPRLMDENGLDDTDHSSSSSYSNATAMAPPMSAVKRMAAGTPVPGTPSLHRGLFKKPGHLTAATPSKPHVASATPRQASQTPGSVKPQPSAAKPTGGAPARRLLFPSGTTAVPGTPAAGSSHASFATTPSARHLQMQTPRGPGPASAKPTPARSMYAAATPAAALSTSMSSVFKTPAPKVHKSAKELARELIASFHEPAPLYLSSEAVDRTEEIEYCPTGKHLNDPVHPNDSLFLPLDHFEIAPIPTFDFLPSPRYRPSSASSSSDDDDQPPRRHPLSPVKTALGVLPPPGPLTAVDIVDLDFDKTAESIEADTSSSCGSDFSDGDQGMFVGSVGLMHGDEESWVGGGSSGRRSKRTLDQVFDDMQTSRPTAVLLFESDED